MKKYTLSELSIIFPKLSYSFLNNHKIKIVTNILDKLGDWFFVGGVVRDGLLGIHTYDIDISTTIRPDIIENSFKNQFTISTIGKKFGTIGIFAHPYTVEITTTRQDIKCDGRWADVRLINSFEIDSQRRDFTINSLLFNGKYLLDYHNGIDHLINKSIIFVGNASHRIEEDHLRVIRFVRFFIRFGNLNEDIDQQKWPYFQEIQNILPKLNNLASERIGSEILNMSKKTPNKINKAIYMLNTYNISKTIFQENLPMIPNNIIENHDQLAFIFKNISIKKLGLPKNVKILKDLLQPYTSWSKRSAQLWLKYRKDDIIEKFFLFHGLNKKIPKFIVDFNIMSYEPKERSRVLLLHYEKLFLQYNDII